MNSVRARWWFGAVVVTGACASGSTLDQEPEPTTTSTTTGSGNAGAVGGGGEGLTGATGGRGGEAATGGDGAAGGTSGDGGEGGTTDDGGEGGAAGNGGEGGAPPYCGDGALDGVEVCDGQNTGGLDCTDFGHQGGTLLCAANCLSFNQSACHECGDGDVEGTELCDGADLDGQRCELLGFAPGALGCNANCTFNTTGCPPSECNDGLDNDADGFFDASDPGCDGPNGWSESIYADDCHGIGGAIYDVTFANTSLDVFVTGSTVGAPDAFQPTDDGDDCYVNNPALSSSEVVLFYRNFVPGAEITFTLDSSLTNYDSVLYVRQTDCQTPLAELCNDDYAYWWYAAGSSQLDLILPIGDYYIFVDGYGSAAGNFELIIDLPN